MVEKYIPKRRFSLVELLIVMSVMAILLSLLQGSLQETMSKARELQCKNQLKSIGSSTFLYLEDYDGQFMTNRNKEGTWDYLLAAYDGRGLDAFERDASGELIYEFPEAKELEQMMAINDSMLCPEDDAPVAEPYQVRKTYAFSGYKLEGSLKNLGLVPKNTIETDWGRESRNIREVLLPAEVLMAAENRHEKNIINRQKSGKELINVWRLRNAHQLTFGQDPAEIFIHQPFVMNTVFVDGRVGGLFSADALTRTDGTMSNNGKGEDTMLDAERGTH